jgi:predicted DNA-binding transcriptional regulator AlpA
MTPRVNTEDLIGAAEIAEMLGLRHANSVTTYLHRYDSFPRPIVELPRSRVRLWLRPQIEEWQSSR